MNKENTAQVIPAPNTHVDVRVIALACESFKGEPTKHRITRLHRVLAHMGLEKLKGIASQKALDSGQAIPYRHIIGVGPGTGMWSTKYLWRRDLHLQVDDHIQQYPRCVDPKPSQAELAELRKRTESLGEMIS